MLNWRQRMKNIAYIFIVIIFLLQTSCVSTAQQQTYEQTKFERKPFEKSPYVIKSPAEHLERELNNGKSYDPNPKAVVIDEKSGKYEFRWIGTDGREKIVPYQRRDALQAVISVIIEKGQEGRFIYIYRFHILSASPVYFREFIVQTLALDAKPIETDDYLLPPPNYNPNHRLMVGRMNFNPLFNDGIWWNFAFVGKEENRIYGGNTIEFQLTSSSRPGIVGCKASGGELGTKGVGEEIPSVLENQIPIFQDLAWGYTIGPVESLAGLSKSERAKYLLDNLPKFQEAGWMSEGTAKNYEAILKKEDLTGALEKAKKDLEGEFITSEVFQIIEGLNQ
jgi:hypothetical protein